ncbi:MAG: hypothetical protein WAS51_14650 [Ilumatobacteraceae bacterium]
MGFSNLKAALVAANDIATRERAGLVVWNQMDVLWQAKSLTSLPLSDDESLDFIVFGPGKHPWPCSQAALEAWVSLVRSVAEKGRAA